ncbi:MAG TPA: DUF6596 domain-containing protein [Lysobacter sp.]
MPFRVRDAEERPQRLGSVLHVLYLIFNEGYATSSGAALHRTGLRSMQCHGADATATVAS